MPKLAMFLKYGFLYIYIYKIFETSRNHDGLLTEIIMVYVFMLTTVDDNS